MASRGIRVFNSLTHSLAGRLFSLTLLLTVAAGQAEAQTPNLLNVQGRLTDSGGVPLPNGNASVTFRLYNVASGGTALWTESQTVAVSNSLFQANLGSVTPLPAIFNQPLWLGMEVNSDGEMAPRTQMTSASYGLNADLLDGQNSTAFAPASGSANYVKTTGDTMSGVLTIATAGQGNIIVDDTTGTSGTSRANCIFRTNGTVFAKIQGDVVNANNGVMSLATLQSGVLTSFLYADQAGRVGISGRVPIVNALEVNGNASKTTTGSWLANSDSRLKKDIQSVENALDTVDRLRPVSFHYNDIFLKKHPDVKDTVYYNYIAQEYQEVFPDSVQDDGEGYLQMEDHSASVFTVRAVQELHQMIKAKDAEIAALKAEQQRQAEQQSSQFAELQSKVSALDQLVRENAEMSAKNPPSKWLLLGSLPFAGGLVVIQRRRNNRQP